IAYEKGDHEGNRLAPRLLYVDFDCDRDLEEEEPVAMDIALSAKLGDPHFVLPPVQGRFRIGGELLHVHMSLRLGLLLPNLVRGRTLLTVHPRTWFAGTLPVAPHCRVFWVPGEKPRFRLPMKTVSSSAMYFGEEKLTWNGCGVRIEGGRFIFSFRMKKAENLSSMTAPVDLLSIWARQGDHEEGTLTCFPSGGKIYLPRSSGYAVRGASYLRTSRDENWLLHVAGNVEFLAGRAFPSPEPVCATFSVPVHLSPATHGARPEVSIVRQLHTVSGRRVGLWRRNRDLPVMDTELTGPRGKLLHSAATRRTLWQVPREHRGSRITVGARLAPDVPFEIRVVETVFTP
ncbi:MAG: hypothetical protein ACYTFG_05665, partial [Planctomycetota bacterium]